MNITFYSTSDPPKKLNKTITPIGTAKALTPTSQIDVLNPVAVINYDSTYGDQIINANYAYIDTFHRYYFIKCSLDIAKRIIVSGSVDYLMSWKDGIANCSATVIRSQSAGVNYCIDKKYPVDPGRLSVHGIKFPQTELEFSNGVTYPQFIMICR